MRRAHAWLPMLLLLPLGACNDDPSGPDEPRGPTPLGSVYRVWGIFALTNDERLNRPLDVDDREGGVVDVGRRVGSRVPLPVAAPDTIAWAEVFSNETGKTYWVGAESPSPWGLQAPDSAIGSEVQLRQAWRFRKDSPDATFQLVVSDVFLEVYDGNGTIADAPQCPWGQLYIEDQIFLVCNMLVRANVEARYWAYADTTCCPEPYFSRIGTADVHGWGDTYTPMFSASSKGNRPLFGIHDFDVQPPVGEGRHVTVRLRAPITVDIPLDSIAVGDAFEVGAVAIAKAWSRRQGESYAGAFFRDPAKTGGLSLAFEGVTMLPPPSRVREPLWTVSPAPPCTASAGASTIQFAEAAYRWPEWPGDEAEIAVTRTGGGAGEASVAFTTGGGTADPSADYEPVTTHVRFADGEVGTRTVLVPIVADDDAEPSETVSLTLSAPAGCVSLGASSAELTILDDDQPLPEARMVGGTVTGLEGTGLELRDGGASVVAIASDGPFAFPAGYAAGASYDVTVARQPSAPLQVCTVANGQGTIGGEDVTDVVVTCVTPAAEGGMDPGFGTGGIVATGIAPNRDSRFAAAVALQPDGKVVAAGREGLARYHADGTLDTSFGDGGTVAVAFGSGDEQVYDVAVQPDGRILVAGIAVDPVNLPANDDVALARFNADGTLDPGFGTGGVVITDFAGRLDAAFDILLQPDGAIVVVGSADAVDQFGAAEPDFAVARYTSAGAPDPTFGAGGDGRVTVDIGGRLNGARAAALQSDGSLVVVGAVAASRGSDPDLGIVRLDRNGVLDPTFGAGGVVWADTRDDAEWAFDVAVDASDRILVAGSWVTGGDADGFVARYDARGAPDPGFGSDGVALTPLLWGANAIALDGAGGIVAVGGTPGDFGVVRLLADGTVDAGFGEGGRVAIDFLGDSDEASAVAIQPDGRIVVGGWAGNGLPVVGLARVRP